jgi:hypothetical protein
MIPVCYFEVLTELTLEEKDNPLIEIPAKKPKNLTDEPSSQHR